MKMSYQHIHTAFCRRQNGKFVRNGLGERNEETVYFKFCLEQNPISESTFSKLPSADKSEKIVYIMERNAVKIVKEYVWAHVTTDHNPLVYIQEKTQRIQNKTKSFNTNPRKILTKWT